MNAPSILTNVAIILLAAAIWQDVKTETRPRGPKRTFLLVAAIFAVVSVVVHAVTSLS